MKIFKINFFLIIIILFSIISISGVSAFDNNVLENESRGNFTELNHDLYHCDNSFNLTKDFVQDDVEDNLSISKSLDINGNNHSINFKHNSSLNINNTRNLSIIFKNISFNGKFYIILKNEDSVNLSFVNCYFNCNDFENNNISCIYFYNLDNATYFTGNITSDIEELAWKIVGNSEGIEAAKKLAKWVGKKIKYELKEGFYQTPSQTLNRRLGNCCSQTDLFLQMCDVVGITKICKVYYVHIGSMTFHFRHFFAVIDNIVIDPSSCPSDPWGHANIIYSISQITEYPRIPLERWYE